MSMELKNSRDMLTTSREGSYNSGWWPNRTGLEQKLLIGDTLLFFFCVSLLIAVIIIASSIQNPSSIKPGTKSTEEPKPTIATRKPWTKSTDDPKPTIPTMKPWTDSTDEPKPKNSTVKPWTDTTYEPKPTIPTISREGCQQCKGSCPSLQDATPFTVFPRDQGYITSPGYDEGDNYPDNVQCLYEIIAPGRKRIRVDFEKVELAQSDGCGGDSLLVFDFTERDASEPQGVHDGRGEPLVSVLKGAYCGKVAPPPIISHSWAMMFLFRTDDFSHARGFKILYSVVGEYDSLCSLWELECKNRMCVHNDKRCNDVDDCGDGTDEEGCPGPVPSVEDCGKREVDHRESGAERIVGGEPAPEGSWPWMADLQLNLMLPNGHICGGSLIHAQWVLTASHCFIQPAMQDVNNIRVHLGKHRKFEKDTYEQIRYAEQVFIYGGVPLTEFDQNKLDLVNDMALIKLNAPVQFTSHVRPICVPPADLGSDIAQLVCYATGWGVTRGTGYNDQLKQAYHPIQEDEKCRARVGAQFHNETMICAGSLSAYAGACHGDSGGPLACELDKVWHVFGVASYVTDTNMIEGLCGLDSRPTVFNKVTAKTDWIKRTIQENTL